MLSLRSSQRTVAIDCLLQVCGGVFVSFAGIHLHQHAANLCRWAELHIRPQSQSVQLRGYGNRFCYYGSEFEHVSQRQQPTLYILCAFLAHSAMAKSQHVTSHARTSVTCELCKLPHQRMFRVTCQLYRKGREDSVHCCSCWLGAQ